MALEPRAIQCELDWIAPLLGVLGAESNSVSSAAVRL